MRDAVGLQGFNSRVIDTGDIIADHVQSVNGELMGYYGPLWIQSETCVSQVNNAVFPTTAAASKRGTLNFWGSYFETGFFLTGEPRLR